MRLSFHNWTEKKTESHKQWPQSYKTSVWFEQKQFLNNFSIELEKNQDIENSAAE